MEAEKQRQAEKKAREELFVKADKSLKALNATIARCEKLVNEDFMRARRLEAQGYQDRIDATRPDDDLTATPKLQRLFEDVSAAQQSVLANEYKKASAAQKLGNVARDNTAPEYQGRKLFGDMGKKEFQVTVTNPVTAMYARIEPKIKSARMLDEAEEDALRKLVADLRTRSDFYAKKAEGIDRDKHPNQRAIYDAYSGKASGLASDLESVANDNVSDAVKAFRARKKELTASLGKLDKVVAMWARIDEEELATQQRIANELRDELTAVCQQAERSGRFDDAMTEMNDLETQIAGAKKAAFDSDESRQRLDNVVGDIGAKCKTQEDLDFVKEAMKTRFGLQSFEGDLTNTNVIAFYKTFKLVPDSHTLKNNRLTVVERTQSLESIESFYQPEEGDHTGGKMVIKAMRTAGPLTVLQNDIIGPCLLEGVTGSKRLDQFTWVTLHEIGHAVDESEGFMVRRGGEFGGWTKHATADVTKMMVKKFCAQTNCPRKFGAAFIGEIVAGKDPSTVARVLAEWGAERFAGEVPSVATLRESDALVRLQQACDQYAVDGWPPSTEVIFNEVMRLRPRDLTVRNALQSVIEMVLDERTTIDAAIDAARRDLQNRTTMADAPNWRELSRAPILAWYKNAKLKEPSNAILAAIKMLSGGDAWVRAGEHTIDGRNWHEAYAGDWYSYDPGIWANRISNYQMRAPGEYFAEAYAAYYLDKMPTTAELYDALEELDEKEQLDNL